MNTQIVKMYEGCPPTESTCSPLPNKAGTIESTSQHIKIKNFPV